MIGLLIGAVLQGVREGMAESKQDDAGRHFSIIETHWDEILNGMLDGKGVDEIGDEFHRRFGIPPTRTVLFVCHFIKSLAENADPLARTCAALLAQQQEIDANTPPLEYIRKFEFDRTLFAASACQAGSPGPGSRFVQGLIMLSKPYLYFFPITETELNREKEFSYSKERAKGLASDLMGMAIPGWDGISTAWDVVSSVAEATRGYFDGSRVQKLQAAFRQPAAFAIPLMDVVSLASSNGQVLSVLQALPIGEKEFHFAPLTTGDRDWALRWKDLIQLACVGEGCLLVS